MRSTSKTPATQLQSVAIRYRLSKISPAFCRWSSNIPSPQERNRSTSRNGVAARWRRDPKLQRVEAVLFLAREPLPSRKLSQYANLADGTEARTLIRQLNRLYDESGRAFRVEEVAGGYQLVTREKFSTWLRRLNHLPAETRLSAPALETLAVIAYRQPILRAELEAIRGVNCGEILRQLMDRDLVKIGGRSEELGRPYLYTTTKRFLQLFGLRNLDELPRAETLRSLPIPSSPLHRPPAVEPQHEDAESSEGESANTVDDHDSDLDEIDLAFNE